MRRLVKLAVGLCLSMTMLSSPLHAEQTQVNFILNNIGGVDPGSQAYAGFYNAANFWSTHLTTSQPVTINLNVGFSSLGPNILGSTRSTFTSKAIVNIENRILVRQSGALDANTVLPTLRDGYFGVKDAVNVYTPGYTGADSNGDPYGIDNSSKIFDTDNSYNNSVIGLTTANAKALGYAFGSNAVDGTIQFSSDFAFDFNPTNGITAGQSDFIAVAIHEIGHALGFVSGVDDYDVLGTGGPAAGEDCGGIACMDYPANDDWFGETLDLFRYSAPGVLDWTTNTDSYFSLNGGLTAYEGGYFSTGTYNGDGWQASHWKAPQLPTGQFSCAMPKLGVMNPYSCSGRNGVITGLDFAALDAIGWNTNVDTANFTQSTQNISLLFAPVPELSTWVMLIFGFAMIGVVVRRRGEAALMPA